MVRKIAYSACIILMTSVVVSAAKWPKIQQHERDLTAVDGHPNASAVLLLKEGRVFITEDSVSSYIDVYTRIKILTQEGTDYGSISLQSSDYMRTKNVEARTHLPDGRVIELPKDATFEKEYSDYYGASVVSCAMPEVVPGAIIEYRYRIFFDSIFFPRMWFFQSEIPTLESSVVYDIPPNIAFAPLVFRTLAQVDFEEKSERNVRGGQISYVGRNLPPVPDEPSRFPFRDLAFRVMLLPTSKRDFDGMPYPLFDSWKNAAEVVWGSRTWGYQGFLGNAGSTKKMAKGIAPSAEPRARAEAIFRWVRDEIEVENIGSVWINEKDADDVLKKRRGDLAEQAALLYAMLKAVKLHPEMVWVNPRDRGRVEQNIPNPTQFFRLLVAIKLGGERIFLDPSDRSLAFGSLEPDLQGVPCLLVSKKKQEWSTTPQLGAELSARDALLALQVDEEGRVSGDGRMQLSGSHAWNRLGWKSTREETLTAWEEWIEDRFSSFDIDQVEVVETIEDQQVSVTWLMVQRDEYVAGDEVILQPSRPLTLSTNPFTIAANRRLTPVQLSFRDLDRVVLELAWPEGWQLDGEPAPVTFENPAGRMSISVQMGEDGRSLTQRRELLISEIEFIGAEAYASLQELYQTAVKHDVEELVLVAQ